MPCDGGSAGSECPSEMAPHLPPNACRCTGQGGRVSLVCVWCEPSAGFKARAAPRRPLNAPDRSHQGRGLSVAPMEERTDFLAESGLYPPQACNLCAIQSEGPESALKQPLTETQRIHPMPAEPSLGPVMPNVRSPAQSCRQRYPAPTLKLSPARRSLLDRAWRIHNHLSLCAGGSAIFPARHLQKRWTHGLMRVPGSDPNNSNIREIFCKVVAEEGLEPPTRGL